MRALLLSLLLEGVCNMTTPVYAFICTKTTYAVVVPNDGPDFQRRTSNAFKAIQQGFFNVGDLLFRPTQDAVPFHLLCDGSVLNKTDFPQLADYLGDTFGGDGVTTFGIPDYSNDFIAMPALTVTQETDQSGTVTTGGTVTTPTDPGQAGGTTGGNVPSGGRPNRVTSEFEV